MRKGVEKRDTDLCVEVSGGIRERGSVCLGGKREGVKPVERIVSSSLCSYL